VTFALVFALSTASVVSAAQPINVRAAALEVAAALATVASPLTPLIRAIEGTADVDYGTDGRLTFLLLGSDSRSSGIEHTDTIMVMSLKGNSISAASIPRDTKRMRDSNGTIFGKVNSILRYYYDANGSNLSIALSKFEQLVEYNLGIEIDYYALIWFDGFTTLVDEVDGGARGIYLNVNNPIYDYSFHDKPGTQNPGVYFPEATNYRLQAWNPSTQTGTPYCDGTFQQYANPQTHPETWCHRALPYVRTRHGTSDWSRAKRQQSFIDATIDSVDFGELSPLVDVAVSEGKGKWWTDLPITDANAIDLYYALQGASLEHKAVFRPPSFATRIGSTNGYELKLSAVRAWCDAYMS
jgi:hypothetical protein